MPKPRTIDPIKARAYAAVQRAIKNGQLKKRPCWCGEIQVHAHHPRGYKRPLDIEWLCSSHHRKAHFDYRKAHPDPRFMDIPKTAKIFGVHYRTVWRIIHHKEIPAIKIDGIWQLDRKAIQKILDKIKIKL